MDKVFTQYRNPHVGSESWFSLVDKLKFP